MNTGNRYEFKEVVRSIDVVDQLNIEQLIEISRKLFELVLFCDCEVDNLHDKILHRCERFNHHDFKHSPNCRCCQQMMLLYYLGTCMDSLASVGRLPQFDEAHLSIARIRDRTYGHIKIGSELIFSIIRHLNAWRDEANMNLVVQNWVFDFAELSLEELPYDTSRVGIGISVRKLMELKSEWRGTATELLAKLNKIARALRIDTRSDVWPNSSWPKSPRKLNQVLQELKDYLQKYGITVNKRRYVELSKLTS